MATLESLSELLRIAADSLGHAAHEIHAVPLDPARPNVLRIANALGEIFEIQRQVYALRPELIPDHLWEAREGSNPSPAQIVEGAFRRASAAEASGNAAMAISLLEFLIRTQPSGSHLERAHAEIARLGSP
jgi:hypothetical protein